MTFDDASRPAQLGLHLDEHVVVQRLFDRRLRHLRHEVAVLGVVGGDAEDLLWHGVDDADRLAALDAVAEGVGEGEHLVATELVEPSSI